MEFCPLCEKRLISVAGAGYRCPKCGCTNESHNSNVRKESRTTSQKTPDAILIHDSRDTSLHVLPTMSVNCPNCSNRKAMFRTQAVGTEDAVTIIYLFRCTQCGYRWRQEK